MGLSVSSSVYCCNLWKIAVIRELERFIKVSLNFLQIVKLKSAVKGRVNTGMGIKQHASVDMQSGLINKVALTPLNQTDSSGFKSVCLSQGAIYADKGGLA